MKNTYVTIGILLLFLMLSSCSRCSRTVQEKEVQPVINTEQLSGKVLFKLTELESDQLAKSGKYVLLKKDIKNDPMLISLSQKKANLLKQVNSEKMTEKSYLLGAVETEVFHRKLILIEKMIKQQALFAEARNIEINVQEYVEKYIFSRVFDHIPDSLVKEKLKTAQVPSGVDKVIWVKKDILSKRKKKTTDYFLEEYILKLPIEVNLDAPNFPLEMKYEWMPHWGPQNAKVQVVIFSGTRNHSEKALISDLIKLKSKYKNLFVGFRPVYSGNDPFQEFSMLMNFCVWTLQPEKYWDYLKASLGDHKEKVEKNLYAVTKKLGMDTQSLKSCAIERKYKDVVTYHLDYAKYLGITSGPVVFVGGEVLYGAVKLEQIEKSLQRQLAIPAAAVW